MAGYSNTANPSGQYQATIWNGTTPTALGSLPNTFGSLGLGINNSGQVAGYTSFASGSISTATIWNGTTPTALGTLAGGSQGYGLGINNSGKVAGYSNAADGLWHATLWNTTTPTLLNMLPGGTGSYATAINNSGQVVGYTNINNNFIATIWNGTDPTILGTLLGGISSEALGINDLGQVVGYSFNSGGTFDAVVWSPVSATPLPSTWGMMLVGLGVIGFMAYRRKSKPALIAA